MKTKDVGAEKNKIEPLSTDVHTQPGRGLPADFRVASGGLPGGFRLASGWPGPTERTRQTPEAQSRIVYCSC